MVAGWHSGAVCEGGEFHVEDVLAGRDCSVRVALYCCDAVVVVHHVVEGLVHEPAEAAFIAIVPRTFQQLLNRQGRQLSNFQGVQTLDSPCRHHRPVLAAGALVDNCTDLVAPVDVEGRVGGVHDGSIAGDARGGCVRVCVWRMGPVVETGELGVSEIGEMVGCLVVESSALLVAGVVGLDGEQVLMVDGASEGGSLWVGWDVLQGRSRICCVCAATPRKTAEWTRS